MKNDAEWTGLSEAEERLMLAQQLKIASQAVENAGFRAAGLLEKGAVTSLFLMAHALEQMSERSLRDPEQPSQSNPHKLV